MSYEDGGMPAGGNSRFRGYPARMSERQQLALILQMTSQEMTSSSSSRSEGTISANSIKPSTIHQKSSKNRWSNKNTDLLDVNTSLNRQEDRLRSVNGCDSKDQNEFAVPNSPDEVRTASEAESLVVAGSPAESAATVTPASSSTEQQQQLQDEQLLDKLTDPYEMRRTPPQNKVDRQANGQQQQVGSNANNSNNTSGSSNDNNSNNSARVTLRLNQVRATRDEKKGTSTSGTTIVATAATTATVTGQTLSRQATVIPAPAGSTTLICNQTIMESSPGKSTSNMNVSGNSGVTGSTNSSSNTSGTGSGATGNNGHANSSSSSSSSTDIGDIYEFKSSKEATPVRGSSSSPNPNPEKEAKEVITPPSTSTLASSVVNTQNQNINCSAAGGASISLPSSTGTFGSNTTTTSSIVSSTSVNVVASTSSSVSGSTSTMTEVLTVTGSDEQMRNPTSPQLLSSTIATSTSIKRAFENENTQSDEQDEDGRKRKKKDIECSKEISGVKNQTNNRQTTSRNNSNISEKCLKSGKQAGGTTTTKVNQSNNSISNDRKSPSSSMNANSPKPNSSVNLSTNNLKGNTSSAAESDGEDDRSKNSDCNSAPKVPPLKIVIPQSTTSEQEQGNRNGKSTSNRSHQLPYVVASSNSNDSVEKEQGMSTVMCGTTSPLDSSGISLKNEEKKDLSGTLDNESRSTHHQRVLRSSHRSGSGSNGTGGSREPSTSTSSNGNHANSSPLPTSTADRSNNSSPQQRHHSPTPESSGVSETGKLVLTDSSIQNSPASKSTNSTDKCDKNIEVKKESGDSSEINIKKESGSDMTNTAAQATVELHPRKRKMKPSKEQPPTSSTGPTEAPEIANVGPEIHPHDQPITNCYQLFLNIRKQIDRRRKGLFPVQPKPPQGFKDYLMNRCTYVLAGNANKEPSINSPVNLPSSMKELYVEQEKERYRLRMQHVVEKEKLVLSVEQEILRVHGRAARALANQSLPFSACTFLKDEEVYNVITPEQEEKDRNARSRYNGRLFLSWLQDVDDKWEKIKEGMLLRHHNEAESLHAVQRMDWEWKLKEVGLCEFKVTPQIEDLHVPMVHVSDDFDLLPA